MSYPYADFGHEQVVAEPHVVLAVAQVVQGAVVLVLVAVAPVVGQPAAGGPLQLPAGLVVQDHDGLEELGYGLQHIKR